MVKSISTGISGSAPAGLMVFGDHLFFFASDANSNKELWRSDGTETGTIAISNFSGDACSPLQCQLKAAGDKLFFTAINSGVGDEELFVFYYK